MVAGFWFSGATVPPPSPQPTATRTPTTTPICPPGSKIIRKEAENAQLQAPMEPAYGGGASSCYYVHSDARDQGVAAFTFNVPECGAYNIWARGKGLGWNNNSFWWSMDGGEWLWWEIEPTSSGAWTWRWDNLGTIELDAGNHTLRFKCREALSRLDRVELSGDPSHQPKIVPCGTPTPTLEARPVSIPFVIKRHPGYFDDHFGDDDLDPRWTWINEDGSRWSLTDRQGFLRLVTHPGRVYEKNLLLQTAPGGDFQITTRVVFEPTSNYQIAGIVLYQDDGNFLVLGRAFCDAGFCVGNGIYFDWVEGGSPGGQSSILATTEKRKAYLRMVHTDGEYSAYYSEDASNWTLVGSHTPSSGVRLWRIGLAAAQDFAEEGLNADFDYFKVRLLE
jgi:hypothetical protein